MSRKHGIGWVNVPGTKGETWNPIVGCSKVSQGCRYCYAETMAIRLAGMGLQQYQEVIGPTADEEGAKWNGRTVFVPSQLEKPLRWTKPRTIFVCSMSDLFHPASRADWILDVLDVIERCPQHTFIVLTKRAARLHDFMVYSYYDRGMPVLKNLWLGVTAEDQDTAIDRIPNLLRTPAAVRWVSVEPMIGPVDLDDLVIPDGHPGELHMDCLHCDVDPEDDGDYHGATIDWVVCGCESGAGRRPMEVSWACSLRNQCQAADVPFFMKQMEVDGHVTKNMEMFPMEAMQEFPKAVQR